jgi:hypothetical protein
MSARGILLTLHADQPALADNKARALRVGGLIPADRPGRKKASTTLRDEEAAACVIAGVVAPGAQDAANTAQVYGAMSPDGKPFEKCKTFAKALGAILTWKDMWVTASTGQGAATLPITYKRSIDCVTICQTWPEATIQQNIDGDVRIYRYASAKPGQTVSALRPRHFVELHRVLLQALANEATGFGYS